MAPKMTFHGIEAEMQALVLRSRKDYGEPSFPKGGAAGRIIKFSRAESLANACVKLPIAGKIGAKEAAVRFLREMRFQRSMFFHEFVHWASDFDLIHDTPIAWFRFWHSDLADLIEDENKLSYEGRLAMLAYIGSALLHCHQRGLIAHQDLKPENIFIFDLNLAFHFPPANVWKIPKLADFGSVNLASEIGEFRGTRPYMAPEQWYKQPLGQHTSVWSLGVIGYELLTFGEHPIGQKSRPWRDGDAKRWQEDKIWKRWMKAGCHSSNKLADAELDDLIARALNVEPQRRPSLEEMISGLIQALYRRSHLDADHAVFRISQASLVSSRDHKWPYLDARFNRVVEDLANLFEDATIIERFRISSEPTVEFEPVS